MITLKHGVRVLFGCTLVYASACGGSTSPGDQGGEGVSGSTQSFAGASAAGDHSLASAGTYGESGGVGVANGGNTEPGSGGAGAELGGSIGSGGANGIGGDAAGGTSGASGSGAGEAGGASSCPAAAPTNGNMCSSATTVGENCLYVGESCTCRAAIVVGPRPGGAGGAGGAAAAAAGAAGAAAAAAARTWRCTGSGAACPASEPATGGMCMNPTGAGAAALDCPYPDGKTCRCTNRTWECTEPPPPACPAKQPTGACTAVQSCNYGTAAMRIRCACDGAAWACDMAGAPAPRCTAKGRAALATGDTCTGIGACAAAGVAGPGAATCVCNGKTVTCN